MRVLHVSQGTTYGLRRYLTDLVADQASRKWEVTLATPADAELESACRELGVAHVTWSAERAPGISTLGEVRALRRIVEDVEPDVVHLHSSKAGLAGRLAVRKRRPTCFTPHAWSFFHEGAITRGLALRWERRAVRWTDVILCVSQGERIAGERAGIRGRFEVVPNAVDLTRYRPADDVERAAVRETLEIPLDRPVAVCVGRLVDQKGQDVLIRAWGTVRESVADAECILVGDGPNRTDLEALAGAGIRFAGDQPDTRAWLVAADVVVQPSRWEGLSLVALEALACGCSIVTTDVPGMREVIGEGDGAAGELVAVDDQPALAAAIVARLSDRRLRDRERGHARERAAAHGIATWGANVARVLEAVVEARAVESGTKG